MNKFTTTLLFGSYVKNKIKSDVKKLWKIEAELSAIAASYTFDSEVNRNTKSFLNKKMALQKRLSLGAIIF